MMKNSWNIVESSSSVIIYERRRECGQGAEAQFLQVHSVPTHTRYSIAAWGQSMKTTLLINWINAIPSRDSVPLCIVKVRIRDDEKLEHW